jgi:hypothetical protein
MGAFLCQELHITFSPSLDRFEQPGFVHFSVRLWPAVIRRSKGRYIPGPFPMNHHLAADLLPCIIYGWLPHLALSGCWSMAQVQRCTYFCAETHIFTSSLQSIHRWDIQKLAIKSKECLRVRAWVDWSMSGHGPLTKWLHCPNPHTSFHATTRWIPYCRVINASWK